MFVFVLRASYGTLYSGMREGTMRCPQWIVLVMWYECRFAAFGYRGMGVCVWMTQG